MKKVLAVLLSVLMLFALVGCGDDPTEGFVEILWPTSELVKRIPVPESTFGDIMSESADYFSVDIGNTTQEQFNAYVAACSEAGFVVDYSKSSDSYRAYDAEGYYVSVYFDPETGVMDITTSVPDEEEETEETSADVDETVTTKKITATTAPKTTTTTKADSSDAIGSDFKEAMDSYEEFMNDYVAFMKKYMDNPSDLSLLSSYATYMSDYADMVEKFEEWEDEDLNTAELAYYIEVQGRVSAKLVEVAQ